jgi:hypothetical protein
MTICPRCGSPCRLRPGGVPTPLLSAWEDEGANLVASVVAEWDRMLNASGRRPLGCSIEYWRLMANLTSWYHRLKTGP